MRIDEVHPKPWEERLREAEKLPYEERIDLWRRSHRPVLIESIKNSAKSLNFVAQLAYLSGQLRFEDDVFLIDEDFARDLAERAAKDYESYELANLIIVMNNLVGAYIPTPLRIVGSKIVAGIFKVPSRQGPKLSKNRLRDHAIIYAIEAAEGLGIHVTQGSAKRDKKFTATRRQRSSIGPECAVDLVVEAFNEVEGHAISYQTVWTVWAKREDSGKLNEVQRMTRAMYVRAIRELPKRDKSS